MVGFVGLLVTPLCTKYKHKMYHMYVQGKVAAAESGVSNSFTRTRTYQLPGTWYDIPGMIYLLYSILLIVHLRVNYPRLLCCLERTYA